MTSAFISYSSKDESLASQVYKILSTAGIPTFMAGISIEPGKQWTDVILKNLKEASWVFFIATKNSCDSKIQK